MSEERFDRIDARLGRITRDLETLIGSHEQLVRAHDRLTASHDGLVSSHDRLTASHERLVAAHSGTRSDLNKLIVMHEETRDRVQLIWEAVGETNERMDRGFGRLESMMQSFIDTQSAINRDLSDRDADHERRIVSLESRSAR